MSDPGKEGDATCRSQSGLTEATQPETRSSDAASTFKPEGAVASYFDNPIARQRLKKEALSWIGTPFGHYYQDRIEAGKAQLKAQGVDISKLDVKGGGIDCIGLVQEIYARIGATKPWNFPREPADYQSHLFGDKVLNWMRGRADDPQSKLLSELFVELEVPESVRDANAETPRDFFKAGDILVLRHGELFHMPVIYDDDLHFVNALPRLGVVEGTIQDSSFSVHLVAAFRLKPDGHRSSSDAAATETENSP